MKSIKTVKPASFLSLCVRSEFRASHSLENFEAPHFHLWQVEAEFSARLPLQEDRLIDLVFLQKTLTEIYQPLENQHLNTALTVSPTSENIALWFWDKIQQKLPESPLRSVRITLCDLEGNATGWAQVQ